MALHCITMLIFMPIHKIVMNSDLHGSAGQCLIHQTIASFLKSKRTGMHLLKQMYFPTMISGRLKITSLS